MSDSKIESVQQAFEQFEFEVVRVPKQENDAAKAVHPEIRDFLAAELPVLKQSFLSGSYSRKVQAGHLKDVDIIAVLDDPDGVYAKSAFSALDDVQKAVRESDLVRRTRKGVRSVKLILEDNDFTVDLVVALEPTGGQDGLLLARYNEQHDDWTLLHPRGQLSACVEKNEACSGIYVPCVRLVKYWLGTQWADHKPFKSYHAEAVLHGALDKKVDYAVAIVAFFEAADQGLAPGVHTADPGYPGSNVDDLLTHEQRLEARQKVRIALQAARAASAEEDVGEALNGWAKVFGSAFPAPDTAPDAISAAVLAGAARIWGTGVRVGEGREIIRTRPWRPW